MRTAAWILPVLLCLAVACSDDSVSTKAPPATPGHPDTIALNREADEAALWLSGELTSPTPLYSTIVSDLAAIRAQYSASVPAVSIQFLAWWLPSKLIVYVNDDLRQKILTHQPSPFDDMNSAMGAIEVDSSRLSVSGGKYVIIYFVGRKHPQRLGEQYMTVPGVTGAYPDSWIGDFSNVYPWPVDGGMSYLFRVGLGDCPAGCESSDFYYFRRINGSTQFVGSFRLYVDPYPAWWSEGKAGFCAFMTQQWGFTTCPW